MLTQRYNNLRNSVITTETTLNTSNVNVNQFGQLFTRKVDGQIYAQPLVFSGINIGGKNRNVVYTVTMHNTVYAFDADDPNAGTPLWQSSLGTSVPIPNSFFGNRYGSFADIRNEIGTLSTPVIDPASKTIFLVSFTQDGVGGPYHQILSALDVSTGQHRPGSPVEITASVPGVGYGKDTVIPQGGANPVQDRLNLNVIFNPMQHMQRPGLLLQNGLIYISFASHADTDPYHGWVMAYDTATLAQKSVWCVTPNGQEGGIWMAGTGPAADSDGNIYVMTGNGGFNQGINYGTSFVRLGMVNGALKAQDYFTPYNVNALNGADADLGSSGILLIPGTNYAVGGGKQGRLYVVDRTNLGKYNSTNDNQIVEWWNATNGHIHGTPVFWKSTAGSWLYVWSEYDYLKAYAFTGAALPFQTTPTMQSAMTVPNGMPGGFMTVSSNGQDPSTGIIWASHPYIGDAIHQTVQGILRAFNASTLQELWNSKMLPTRDDFGFFSKYSAPTVVNGKVYMATFSNQLAVYGQLPKPPAPTTLQATSLIGQVALSWVGNQVANSYSVKRSTTSGGPYQTIASGLTDASYIDSRVTNETTYYYVVTGANPNGESTNSNQVKATPSQSLNGQAVYQINAGGGAVSPFSADTYGSGGTQSTSTTTISTAKVSNPAPMTVYQSDRWGDFKYVLPGLIPNITYKVRLHFSETALAGVGKRVFNVLANGAAELTNYDIYAAAGGKNIADIQEFTAQPDSAGKLTLTFVSVANKAKVSGIEVLLYNQHIPTAPSAPDGLTAVAGDTQATLSWSSVANALSYKVKRSLASGGPYSTVISSLTGTSYTNTGLTNGVTYYYVISSVNDDGESANSAQVSATPNPPASQVIYQINCGDGNYPPFSAERFNSGGYSAKTTSTVDTSGAANPAPQGVYQSERWGRFSYNITGLTPGSSYKLRLHFSEFYWNAAGKRIFNLFLNGTKVLSNFDIYATAGGRNKAIVKEFTATADSTGAISITVGNITDNAKLSGFEVISQ